jgi:prolyl 4-hydroxylase
VCASLHTHEFWRKERTAESIEQHVLACLSGIATGESALRDPSVNVVSSEPPLVVIHDFLSRSDCEKIIQAAKDTNQLQRSTTGATQAVGSGRTSSTVWLKDEQCQDPLRRIASQLSAFSGLPASHMENLQVCKYMTGDEFKLHTDHQDSFNDLECRGRLATCLIYLTGHEPSVDGEDINRRGGETWFPGVREDDENLSIAPTQGSAVFFWNTIEKPGVDGYHENMFLNTDMRLRHAGLPVLTGEKWICNRWIHPIDFGAGVRGV